MPLAFNGFVKKKVKPDFSKMSNEQLIMYALTYLFGIGDPEERAAMLTELMSRIEI